MSELLEPCPFCGGEAEELYLEDEDNFGGSVISCKKCGASSAVHFDRKTNLYSSWNDRARPSPVSCGRCADLAVALEDALTPSAETKYAYHGEFSFTDWRVDENGVEQGYQMVVPWTTVKEIMAAIRARAARTGVDGQ